MVFSLWSSFTPVYFNFAISPVIAFHFVPSSLENWIYKRIARTLQKKTPSCFDHTPPQNRNFLVYRAETIMLAEHKTQNPEPERRVKTTVKAHNGVRDGNSYDRKDDNLQMCMVCRCYSDAFSLLHNVCLCRVCSSVREGTGSVTITPVLCLG